MKFVCGGMMVILGFLFEVDCSDVRVILGLLFEFCKEVEEDAIVGDEEEIKNDGDEVEKDEMSLNNQVRL